MRTDNRLNLLQSWLTDDLNLTLSSLEPASADASFRRYFRAQTQLGGFVVMDAPPDKESLDDFIRIDQALINQAVHAPIIHHQDKEQGFLLLEDLGDQTLLSQLHQHAPQANMLYQSAIQSLTDIQLGHNQQIDFKLSFYDQSKLNAEMQLFEEWYLGTHLSINLNSEQQKIAAQTKELLVNVCLEQPQVWVHRDYHSRNIMVLNCDDELHIDLGIIDFQDMVLGPISYDLASLFKDCYIQWPREQQLVWLNNYYQKTKQSLQIEFSFDQLIRWYDLTGLQRHLKVLGIFCRLNYRDGKTHYLNDLPLVKHYIEEVCQHYSELNDFATLFNEIHS